MYLSSESRTAVDEMVSNAIAAGGNTYNEPQDHGFMYAHVCCTSQRTRSRWVTIDPHGYITVDDLGVVPSRLEAVRPISVHQSSAQRRP